MCGIVGAAARRDIVPVLIEGLRRLEYRGYDSCGLALVDKGTLDLVRTVSRVNDLAAKTKGHARRHRPCAHALGDPRRPATENAHPLVSRGEIAVVHNGIIENHDELRAELKAKGYQFASQTDTEVIAHLVHSLYKGDLLDAVRRAAQRLVGAYAIAVVAKNDPGTVVGARAGSPLVVGVGKDENFLASDALALAGTTDRIAYLEEGDVAAIDQKGWRVVDADGRSVEREVRTVKTSGAAAELGPYRHFMQKEIFEQPRAVADTLESVGSVSAELFGTDAARILQDSSSILILACGTSYTPAWSRASGSSSSPASGATWRSRANTAIAPACPIRKPWWW
jgi:glucosamine--fructose-6-phosphate aminotransferase (isomerizing)